MDVRKAETTDIKAAVELVERSRRQFQKFQPTFWRKAEKSAATTEAFFTKLLADEEEHVDWLESQLHQIKEMGYERYLTMQIAGPKD